MQAVADPPQPPLSTQSREVKVWRQTLCSVPAPGDKPCQGIKMCGSHGPLHVPRVSVGSLCHSAGFCHLSLVLQGVTPLPPFTSR